jgi:hypothetical protein
MVEKSDVLAIISKLYVTMKHIIFFLCLFNKIGVCLFRSRPSGFWITNPRNTVINNHAAGGEGTGIWVIFPKEPLPPSRQFNLMEEFEVRRTPLKDFTNNVAHSNDFVS